MQLELTAVWRLDLRGFKAHLHVRVDRWRIGTMIVAALVRLHLIYDRTT